MLATSPSFLLSIIYNFSQNQHLYVILSHLYVNFCLVTKNHPIDHHRKLSDFPQFILFCFLVFSPSVPDTFFHHIIPSQYTYIFHHQRTGKNFCVIKSS